MRPLRPFVVLIVASSLLAGCGSDSPARSSSPSGTAGTTPGSASTSKSIETGSASGEVPAPPSTGAPATSASRGPQQCAQQGDITIKIVLGDLDCASAYDVARRYDLVHGEKRQTVRGFVCETGNAMTLPTIFTCTNRAQGTEFAVDET